MRLSNTDKAALGAAKASYCRAGMMLQNGPQLLSLGGTSKFSPAVQAEMQQSVAMFTTMSKMQQETFGFKMLTALPRLLSDTRDPVFWDQALWENVPTANQQTLRVLSKSLEDAPGHENRISVLLAVAHAAQADAPYAAEFLESISEDKSNAELAEWSTLLLREMLSIAHDNTHIMNAAVSSRGFNYDPAARFDVVLPLMFSGSAFTRIGPVVKRTVISPLWFYKIFGRASALVKMSTIDSNLIVEKRMEGTNPDGSAHYEVFPFTGDTQQLAPNVRSHNYWAELSRPFYSSGRTGLVGAGDHVVAGVRMTFQRVAETQAADRYQVTAGKLVETTRGLFFGQGHVEPSVLLRNRFDLQPGNFQLCSAANPITGGPANTQFYGTFYGKVSDWNNDGLIDFNTMPVHSTEDGKVDLLGDGSMIPTTLRPQDWT